MIAIEPYLNFGGNAKEALAFYEKALGGKVTFSQTFGESPGGDKMPPEYKDRLMHANFKKGDLKFMASDGPPGYENKQGNNVTLALHGDSIDELEKAFTGLSEGGTVTMPLQETFWAERFGMLIDKYGVNWMVNHSKAGTPV
jgi:PhnB protein